MTITRHEIRRGKTSFLIWTGAIAFLMATCIFLWPEMKSQMDGIGSLFSSMGSFTAAFGMDRLNFGTLVGFYAVEGGNMIGIGGALFSAIVAVSSLAKEEHDHTAEFLFAHPVSRTRVITEKLLSVFTIILILNAVVLLLAIGSILMIGEEIFWKELLLFHLAYLLMQLEIGGICFGVSAFLVHGGLGIGIGIAGIMYFLNIVANISDSAKFLKYITAFGYTETADIINSGKLELKYLVPGLIMMVIGIACAYGKYTKKDLR